MRYARIDAESALVMEVVSEEAYATFNEALRAQFVQVKEGTDCAHGYLSLGKGKFQAPEDPAADASRLRLLTAMEFYLAFTPQERIAVKASTNDMVVEFWATYQLAAQTSSAVDPNLGSVSQGIDYLVSEGLVAQGRKADILAGVAQ